MRIGIIGAGAIANYLMEQEMYHDYEVVSLLVRDEDKYAHIKEKYEVTLCTNVEQFLQSPIDIVIEAATVEAVQSYLPRIIEEKDAIIISIGAFVEDTFLQKITKLASEHHREILLPSGSIGGLDLVQNVFAAHTVDKVTLTTRKPAHTLVQEALSEEQIAFSGSAREAIAKYPKNINISIALSLAGIGFDQTKVTMIADPNVDKNIHTINVSGSFGTASFNIENNPLPSNPSTSYLAAISIIGILNRRKNVLRIG